MQPVSKNDLLHDLRAIGIREGMQLMVHSSLSKIGWVIGGAPTVVSALIEVIGNTGTLVMPAATPLCLHPESWDDMEIPENWISKIADHLPVFDKGTTPTTMGTISETFRTWPQTIRSDHSISSVCAWGKLASVITAFHNLEISEGAHTPYEKVYESGFDILLLGVGFNRCTMLHFAESRSAKRRLTTRRYPVNQNNKRVWLEVPDMGNDNCTHFPIIGEQYLANEQATKGKIGAADAILLPVRDLVDFGTYYFDHL